MLDPVLRIDDLHVEVTTPGALPTRHDPLLRGLDLTVNAACVHAILGPNGAGKTTLARALLGAPDMHIGQGSITLSGDDITAWPTAERAKAGLFVGFQHPVEVAGVRVGELLHRAVAAVTGTEPSVREVRADAAEWMQRLGLASSFVDRRINEGYSAGESRRSEVVQMAMLRPDVAYLDDIDSGLDNAAVGAIARGIEAARRDNPRVSIAVAAHSRPILDALDVDHVHILIDGRIVTSGGRDLIDEVESNGYDAFTTSA